MKILKFGGSSLATTDCIRGVARIVLEEARRGKVIVVLSAFQGVTNQLLDCARLAEKNDRRFDAAWKKITGRHRLVIDGLVGRRRGIRIRSQVNALLGDLHDALHGVQLLGHSPPRALDLIVSFGERLCALIVAAHLGRVHPAQFVDARQLVVTDNQFMNANVIFSRTNRAAQCCDTPTRSKPVARAPESESSRTIIQSPLPRAATTSSHLRQSVIRVPLSLFKARGRVRI